VKANQGQLYQQLQRQCERGECLGSHTSTERQRGRTEHRRVEVYGASQQARSEWCGLERFVRCTRWGTRQGHAYERTGYYISDLGLTAEQFARGIREHWGVENGLHWVKDKVFGEDSCRIRLGSGPEVMSLLRNLAIWALAKKGSYLTKTMRMVVNRPDRILQLLE
jgi:predicted transposase YbfD/YdcC